MRRTALLRTRCGCEQYMAIDIAGNRFVELPLRPDCPVLLSINGEDVILEDYIHVRRFERDGTTRDGITIYTEVYPH